MSGFEYKVVPAPMRGLKAKGVKGTPARFANALESVMNAHGAEGWEYQRTDTLPVEERQGLTGKTTSFQNMLVFRRPLEAAVEDTPEVAALIEDQTPVLAAAAAPQVEPEVEEAPSEAEPTAPVEETPEAVQLNAEDRVSETLKTPIAFPWSNRRDPKANNDSGDKDTNIPAE